MKKGILIASVILIIIIGVIAVFQVNHDNGSDNIENEEIDSKRVPQKFTVGLTESIGIAERP